MALGSMAVAVKHVGSTSVPGLSAKPILDIAVALAPGVSSGNMGDSVRRTVLQDEQRPSLIALVATEDVTPRQQCGDDVQHDAAQWERWLAFRDLVRNDSRALAGYDRLNANSLPGARTTARRIPAPKLPSSPRCDHPPTALIHDSSTCRQESG